MGNYKKMDGVMTTGLPVGNPGYYSSAWITTLPDLNNKNVRFNIFHGIEMRDAATIKNCRVEGYAWRGLQVSGGIGTRFGETNIDVCEVSTSSFNLNKGSGIGVTGVSANVINFIGNDIGFNQGNGIFDNSHHGNLYIGNNLASNLMGNHYCEGAISHSIFIGQYVEGGTVADVIGPQMTWLGGNSGFDDEFSKGGILQKAGGDVKTLMTKALQIYSNKPSDVPGANPVNRSYLTTLIGQGVFQNKPVLFGFELRRQRAG